MLESIVAKCLTGAGVRHGFFARTGGVSGGNYASLNCGFGSRDAHEGVAENRRRVAEYLMPSASSVLTVHQVHSAVAVVVDRDIARADLPKADGLVTATRGLVIGALAADCAPVLFADREAGVIGAAHAGWRGAVGGIVEATVAAMESIGARRERIAACVGPCINQRNYEVGEDFKANLVAMDAANAAFFVNAGASGLPHFDLPGFAAAQLAKARVGTIERQTPCTYENESLFFSFRRTTHRKEPDYGRQISALVLL
ncbi:MAG: peptidoglycan editing factor PgeF [Hyphomicrobiaceae bacterium]